MIDTKELFNRNSDFRNYVNAYASRYSEGKSISVYDALEHRIVKEVANQIGGMVNDNFSN